MKTNWSVLAVCQEPESRQKAVQFCDELVRRFWDNYDISVSWFTEEELRDPSQSKRLYDAAQRAKLVIVEACTDPIPPESLAVLERCLQARKSKEGLFAGIAEQNTRNALILRNMAHRTGMDFISEVPPNLEGAMPDSLESCTSRAHEVSHLLSDILRRPPGSPPPLL